MIVFHIYSYIILQLKRGHKEKITHAQSRSLARIDLIAELYGRFEHFVITRGRQGGDRGLPVGHDLITPFDKCLRRRDVPYAGIVDLPCHDRVLKFRSSLDL